MGALQLLLTCNDSANATALTYFEAPPLVSVYPSKIIAYRRDSLTANT